MADFMCIQPTPLANFYADEYDLTSIGSGTNFWNTSVGANNYVWNYGDGTPNETEFNAYHEFLSTSTEGITSYLVTLYATSDFGCLDSTSRYIYITPELIVYVPNTFTPDNDAFNPIFQPIFTSGVDTDSYTLLIFNRWGQVVFESHDITVGWDGSYGSNNEIDIVQDGTYTWKIDFKISYNDKKITMTGHVNVIR
jgi:gliding motility-associated-like protein